MTSELAIAQVNSKLNMSRTPSGMRVLNRWRTTGSRSPPAQIGLIIKRPDIVSTYSHGGLVLANSRNGKWNDRAGGQNQRLYRFFSVLSTLMENPRSATKAVS